MRASAPTASAPSGNIVMDLLNFFADWLNLKGVLIACLIFIPLERLLAMHPHQRIFRRGWWNDVIYLFINGWLIKLGILIIIVGRDGRLCIVGPVTGAGRRRRSAVLAPDRRGHPGR